MASKLRCEVTKFGICVQEVSTEMKQPAKITKS
jgi:hypothetical protein